MARASGPNSDVLTSATPPSGSEMEVEASRSQAVPTTPRPRLDHDARHTSESCGTSPRPRPISVAHPLAVRRSTRATLERGQRAAHNLHKRCPTRRPVLYLRLHCVPLPNLGSTIDVTRNSPHTIPFPVRPAATAFALGHDAGRVRLPPQAPAHRRLWCRQGALTTSRQRIRIRM